MKTAIMIIAAMVMAMEATNNRAIGQPPPIPEEERPEALTRGPINEAFAQPVVLEDQTGMVAPIEPPPDIEEVPPQETPAGKDITWIPGYWAWDSDRNGYIWVSGCWREAPPGMSWIPGYWVKVTGGWRWVGGFWSPVSENEIEYLPAPPALTNVGPPEPAPSPDKIWAPPCWYWDRSQFVYRLGYWIDAREDWIWAPSHYVWTPHGYVFVKGYWDYPLDRRGVLFAPVYFPVDIYNHPRFSYTPSIAIHVDNLEFGLFSRPRYSHYYFGDYYDSFYISVGIFPWFECEQRHKWYDPIYVHDRWRHRKHEPTWDRRVRQEYVRRRADKGLRKPPIFKVERTKLRSRQQISRHNDDVIRFTKERSHWESKGAPATDRKKAAPTAKHKITERRRVSPKKSAFAEHAHRPEPTGQRVSSGAPPARQKPAKVSPRLKHEQDRLGEVNVRQKISRRANGRNRPVTERSNWASKRAPKKSKPNTERVRAATPAHRFKAPSRVRAGIADSHEQRRPLKVKQRINEQRRAGGAKSRGPSVGRQTREQRSRKRAAASADEREGGSKTKAVGVKRSSSRH